VERDSALRSELWGCHCRVVDPWRHTSSQISATW